MYPPTISILYCLLLCHVTSSPLDPRAASSRTSVFQSVQKAQNKTGPEVLASIYDKYNSKINQPIQAPDDVSRAANWNDGTVESIPGPYDVEYLSPVSIGGKTLDLAIDTGSADLWVFSSSLGEETRYQHSIYNPESSPSAHQLEGYTWNITYGDGSGASGDVYLDNVQVGNTKAPSQAVETANEISESFRKDVDSDGLLGLGFGRINQVRPDKQKTFFSNVKSTLQSPVFTADLKKEAPGSYDFGFIDARKHSGAIEYVPVDTGLGFWQFTYSGYQVGNGAFTDRSMEAIMDTGTTLLLLQFPVVAAYYSKVQGASYDSDQGGYVFPCSTTLPDLTLRIGGYKAVVPGTYMAYAPIDLDGDDCYGALQRNTGIPFAIFGDVFIKSQFVVFDANGPRLGIAPKQL